MTNDATLYEQVLCLSNHGRARGQTKQFWPDTVGFKYKMSNVQAALGCAQLVRIDTLVQRKREILDKYIDQFCSHGIKLWGVNADKTNCSVGAWMVNVVLDQPSKQSMLSSLLQDFLRSHGIDARPFFHPLSSTPPFVSSGSRPRQTTFSYSLPPVSLNLPCFNDINDEQIERVVSLVKQGLMSFG